MENTTFDAHNSNTKLIRELMFRLLPNQILLSIVTCINGITSSLFATNFIGFLAMSAIGLFNPVSMLVRSISTILLGGTQIIFGTYMGKNQIEKTQNIFSINTLISAIYGLLVSIFFIVLVVFGFSRLFTSDPEVLPLFNYYLIGQTLGIIPMILAHQLSGFLSLLGQAKRATIGTVSMIISNLSMSYLLVVVLDWGVFGLALSNSIGYWCYFLVEATYFIKKDSLLKYIYTHLDFHDIKQIVQVGLPGALVDGYMTLRGIIVNSLLMTYVGSIGISVFATADSFMSLIWALPAGCSAVSRMMISIVYGEEDRRGLVNVMKTAQKYFVPLVLVVDIIIILMAEPIASLFYQDKNSEVYQLVVSVLRVLPLCMPLSTIRMNYVPYLQAIGRNFFIHIVSLLDGLVVIAVSASLLVPLCGTIGVAYANVINGVVVVASIIIYAWILNKRFPTNIHDLLALPKDFGTTKDNRMDLMIHTMEEVVTVSSKVHDFCKRKGVDEKESYYAALAIEEMVGNVIDHGFNKDNKQHNINVLVFYRDEELTIRIKDDCIPFNPKERLDMTKEDDLVSNIGIRMIYKMAKDVKYQNLLGLNVLTIKV